MQIRSVGIDLGMKLPKNGVMGNLLVCAAGCGGIY
jgi:hypothetical protein